MKIQGHRGSSDHFPENTIIALQKAVDEGADGIEFDIRKTLDGEFVIIHDLTLQRTTNGTGTVADSNLSYIKTLDAGSWKSPVFAGTKVPTLREVFQHFRNQNITLVLNIYENAAEDIKAIVDMAVTENVIDNCHFFASTWVINVVKEYRANVITYNSQTPNLSNYMEYLNNAIQNGHTGVSITPNETPQNLQTMISTIKEAGKKVHISYINDNYQYNVERFRQMGADYLLGNDVAAMFATGSDIRNKVSNTIVLNGIKKNIYQKVSDITIKCKIYNT